VAVDIGSGVNPQITDAIAEENVTSIGGQSAMLSNLTYANLISNINLSQQNAVANQQAMNQLLLTVTGKIVNMLANLSPLEAISATKLFTGNVLAEQLADLKATVDAFNSPPTSEAGDKAAPE
jgi:hypothetical protein